MADYEIGYGKPPRHTQFKSGNCANPHGRHGKRGVRTKAQMVKELLKDVIEFREGGKLKRAPRLEVLIRRYGAAALQGDIGAADALLKIRENFEMHPAIEEPVKITLNPLHAVVL
jgi:hypothetical protein